MPYDNQLGLRAFCPRPVSKCSSPSPSPGPLQEVTKRPVHLHRARMAGVRRHWRLAKRLSPSLTEVDLKGWFISAPFGGKLPHCPLCRLKWLIKIRARLIRNKNALAHLRIDAAIWAETKRLKHKTNPFCAASSIPTP